MNAKEIDSIRNEAGALSLLGSGVKCTASDKRVSELYSDAFRCAARYGNDCLSCAEIARAVTVKDLVVMAIAANIK